MLSVAELWFPNMFFFVEEKSATLTMGPPTNQSSSVHTYQDGARDPSYKGSEITPGLTPMKKHGCKWVFH